MRKYDHQKSDLLGALGYSELHDVVMDLRSDDPEVLRHAIASVIAIELSSNPDPIVNFISTFFVIVLNVNKPSEIAELIETYLKDLDLVTLRGLGNMLIKVAVDSRSVYEQYEDSGLSIYSSDDPNILN